MEIEPVPVKTAMDKADWAVLLFFLIPLAVVLLVYDQLEKLWKQHLKRRDDVRV